MADSKLSALAALAVAPASDDEIYIRDISEAAADESKRILISTFMAFYDSFTATLTNKSIVASQLTSAVAVANGGTALTASPVIAASISAAAMKGTTTAGAGDTNKLPESAESTTNKVNYDYIAFDQTTEENAFFQYALPRGWDESTVTFRAYWTAASGSGTFICGLKGLARSDDDAIDTAFGTEVTVTDTLITAGDVHVSPESSAVTIGGTPAEGDLVFFNVARKTADDTLTADAQLLAIELRFTRASYTD